MQTPSRSDGASNRSLCGSSSRGSHGPARRRHFEGGRDGRGVSIGVGGVDRSAWR